MTLAYLRPDGQKGIRNVLLVVPLVECAKFVAERILQHYPLENDVHLVHWSGCYPNEYGFTMLKALTSHANVGGVLFLSLGCESMDRQALQAHVAASGRWNDCLVIQEEGGTATTIQKGVESVRQGLHQLAKVERGTIALQELVVGTICGGSDATSGITANPSVGRVFDHLVALGGTCLFEETGELIGCEAVLQSRAKNSDVAEALMHSMTKAYYYYEKMGHASFAPGNAEGGLSTIEEKSMGAYCKNGDSLISGVVPPGTTPADKGLYLLDVVSEGEPRYGFPNINDNAEIMELISCGCHLILFTTGRGSVVGSAISPVIKVCANPKTYARMSDDMDVNAGAILSEGKSLDQIAETILQKIESVASGNPSLSEALGHREAVLTYKGEFPPTPKR